MYEGPLCMFNLSAYQMYPPGGDHLLYVKECQKSGFPLDCFKYNRCVIAQVSVLESYGIFGRHCFLVQR